jgi:hypothetical protein
MLDWRPGISRILLHNARGTKSYTPFLKKSDGNLKYHNTIRILSHWTISLSYQSLNQILEIIS